MNRYVLLAGLTATWLAGWCRSCAAGEESGKLVHTVIFYLKKDTPQVAAEALITDAHDLLAKIPSVRLLKVGRRVGKTRPELGNTDFQIGLLVLFDDAQGLSQYLEHPKHKEYVGRHQKVLEKVVAYDFEDPSR